MEKTLQNISFILQFIDSTRFMKSSLLNLVNNISKGIHKIICKYGHDEFTELNISNATVFLNMENLKII